MEMKFEGVDILDALEKIMDLHTQHYKGDFDLDKELIQSLAVSENPEDQSLLWMSRPCGTYCLREREVYLQDSYENKVWMFYHEQTKDPILAYAVHLDHMQDGKVLGTIYPLDYHSHAERTKLLTCPIAREVIAFEDGAALLLPYPHSHRQVNELEQQHGKIKAIRYEPESERELATILRREQFKRSYHAKPGEIQEYIDKLRNGTVRGRLKETLTATTAKKAPHKGAPER